jgi:hypothetical protein
MSTIATYDDYSNPNRIVVNDIALDEIGENIKMLSDEDSILRVVKHRVQTRKFECQLNMNKGVPYFETIFDSPSYLGLFISNLKNEISSTNGVESISYLHTDLDTGNRKLKYECGFTTQYKEEVING